MGDKKMGDNMKAEQVLVPMRLAPEEKERLYARAKAEGISANELVRRMVRGDAPAQPAEMPAPPAGSTSWDAFVTRSAPIPPRRFLTHHAWSWESEATWAVGAGYHVLLVAPHGAGKSVWAMNLAATSGRAFYLATGRQSRETLEGQFLPRPGTGTVELAPYDGIVSSAAAQPAVCLFEEFTMLNPDSQDKLLTALNTHGGVLDVSYRAGHVVIDPAFQMIATANPPRSEYLGTERLNAALLSRWYVLEIPCPSVAELLNFSQSVGLKYPANKPLCELAVMSYEKFSAGEWDNIISPREIALFARGARANPPSERTLFYGVIANKFAQGRTAQEQAQIRAAIWDLYDGLLKRGRTP